MGLRAITLASIVMASFPLIAGCSHKPTQAEMAALPAPGDSSQSYEDEDGRGSQADLRRSAGSDRVFFAVDAYALDPSARETLRRQALWLAANPTKAVTIEGHCDERGTREYNVALGERRANAAKNFLASQGVSPSRMSVVSYGKERPEALGSDEQSYTQNRRAVTVVLR